MEVPRKGEEEGSPAKGAKRKKGRVKTGQKTIKSCNCNCRKFLGIPKGNYFLQLHSQRKNKETVTVMPI